MKDVQIKKVKWEPTRSAYERAGKQVQIIEARRFGRGPGARLYCTFFFIFVGSITLCPLYKLTLPAKVTLLLRVSLSYLV